MFGLENIEVGYLKQFVSIFSHFWCKVYPFQAIEVSCVPHGVRLRQKRGREMHEKVCLVADGSGMRVWKNIRNVCLGCENVTKSRLVLPHLPPPYAVANCN